MTTPVTRDQLHASLRDAAVVEQQLGLQYLYAATSLQWIPPPELPKDDPRQTRYEAARGAAKTLLLIARQEMEHQGWVQNLLLATGAPPPPIDAPAMPHELPFGGPARLEPFSRDALLRFIAYERPDHLDDPAGPCAVPADLATALADLEATDPDGFGTPDASAIYDHYAATYDALVDVEVTDGPLVVPPTQQQGHQVVPDDAYGVHCTEVTSFADALGAIDQVVLEGEGGSSASLWWSLDDTRREQAALHGIGQDGPPPASTTTPDRSHFCRLVELWPLVSDDTTALPVLDVPTDPSLHGGPGVITHPFSVEMVAVAERAHGIVLDGLRISYAATGLEPLDTLALSEVAFFQSMTMIVRPLLMTLARLPRTETPDDLARAGMTFRATERFAGPFDGSCDEARSDVVRRLARLSTMLGQLLGDEALVPQDTQDRDVVVRLLQGLQKDLLRIGENLAVDSTARLGG